MRKARPRKWDRNIVLQLIVRTDHAIVHIGRVLGIVEKHQLTRRFIHFGMRGYTVKRNPAFGAKLIQRKRIKAITLSALVEGRKYLASMHNDIS